MFEVKRTFQERTNEINIYYNFIDGFILTSRDENLDKILKSNLILMLYNLVESTILNAIEEIHNNIHANNISFNVLKLELKQGIVALLKKRNPHEFVNNINDIAIDIVKKSFNREKAFSGNVDSRKITELSAVYGFSSYTTYAQTKHGHCLRDIKGKRNDLAHGIFSFVEVGKEYSVQDLEKMKDEAINYIKEIISNIENYLINQEYKQEQAII